MRSLLLCLLVVPLAVAVSPADRATFDYQEDFPSKFLGNSVHNVGLLDLMNDHLTISLDYLHASKYYGSQYEERPGLSKLLAEESDRHWEEGISVLKKYLQLGGTTPGNNFLSSMIISVQNDLFGSSQTSHVKYLGSLKSMVEKSRSLVDSITDLYHDANHKISGHGDADVAHFLQEKAEKESEVARKMVGHYITLQKMDASGIAAAIFDHNM